MKFQADILNRVSDAVLVTGRDETITYANAAAVKLLKGCNRQYMGRKLPEFHDELLVSGPGSDKIRESLIKTGIWQANRGNVHVVAGPGASFTGFHGSFGAGGPARRPERSAATEDRLRGREIVVEPGDDDTD